MIAEGFIWLDTQVHTLYIFSGLRFILVLNWYYWSMFLELSRLPTHVYLGIYNINTFTGIFSKIFKVLFILYLLKMKWLLLKQEKHWLNKISWHKSYLGRMSLVPAVFKILPMMPKTIILFLEYQFSYFVSWRWKRTRWRLCVSS